MERCVPVVLRALVDANVHQPRLHELLELENTSGLGTLLRQDVLQRQIVRDGKTMEEMVEADPRDVGAVESLLQCAFFENLFGSGFDFRINFCWKSVIEILKE